MGFSFARRIVSQMHKMPQILRASLWLVLICMGAWLYLTNPVWLKQLNWLLHDQIVKQAANEEFVESVVLIDIDEESIQLLSAWPWSRSLLANLIEKISEHGAKVIALDIIFPDKSDAIDDDALQSALTKYQAILPVIWDYRTTNSNLMVGGLPVSNKNQVNTGSCFHSSGYVTSYDEMNASAKGIGHISPVPDEQGVMRFIPPLVCHHNKSYPMLALTMLQSYYDQVEILQVNENFFELLVDGRLHKRSLVSGLWTIPYGYEMASFTSIPAWRILSAQNDVDLAGKAVIIGSSAVGLNDRVATPLLPIAPGMLLHAQMFADLIKDKPESAGLIDEFYLTLVIITTAILALIIANFSIRLAIIWWLFFSVTHVIFTWIIYVHFGELVSVAGGLLFIFVLFITQSILEWSLVKKQSHLIYQLFKDYLPETVLTQVAKNPDASLLAPQQKEVTILFADLVGFTRMTESMSTAEAAALTREVLSILTESIHLTDGTVDKYMGDAVMAFWNAPLNQPEHRNLAIKAALLMRSSISTLNKRRAEELKPLLEIHVGINTGEVLVGDLGTEWRHAYTVLGDAVNVAQRLMIVAHDLETDIVIGRATASCCYERLVSKGRCHLTGRKQLEEVFVMPVTDIV